MGQPYASGRIAIAICDRCGQQFRLGKLKGETVKGAPVNNLVCSSCWDKDHPQLMLGTFPIIDPQALDKPRPDPAMIISRDLQWGWNPVGGARGVMDGVTPNNLVTQCLVGTVTVTTT